MKHLIDAAMNAETANPVTWEMMPDYSTRSRAAMNALRLQWFWAKPRPIVMIKDMFYVDKHNYNLS